MKFKITAMICAASLLLSSVSMVIADDMDEYTTGTVGGATDEPYPIDDADGTDTASETDSPSSTEVVTVGDTETQTVSDTEGSIEADITTVYTETADISEEITGSFETESTGETESSGESESTADDEPQESVQSIIYRFLTEELGLCSAAAAGIMGNVMIECGFDPSLEVIDTNNKPSFGIMMWNGPRYEALKKWCEENGFDKTDPLGQMGYLKWELENTEKGSYASMKNIPDTAEGAVLAAILWADEFERCTKTSYGLRVYYALNSYWQDYAMGGLGESEGVYGYYYNVPDNLKVGEPLTLYGAVVSYTSPLKTLTAGVYTEDGKLVTGRTVNASNHVGNIGVIDRFIVMNNLPKGSYYYTITAKNESGEYIVERHRFTVTDEPTKSTLVYETEGGGLCEMGASCPSFRFLDMVPVTHWSHGDVDFVLSNKFFLGNGEGYFLPETNMNRAMFVTVLHRLADKYSLITEPEIPGELVGTSPESEDGNGETGTNASAEEIPTEGTPAGESDAEPSAEDESASDVESLEGGVDSDLSDPVEYPFADVDYNGWYGEHVLWAYGYDLIKGKGDGVFDPDGEITRGELAVLMYRAWERSGFDVSDRADLDSFADAETVPDWAREEISWAVAKGLINGTVNGTSVELSTMDLATREQVAAIVRRFAAMIGSAESDGDTPGEATNDVNEPTEEATSDEE